MANEILLMAEVLSSEKNVDKQVIFEAIEAALSTATRKRNREDIGVRVAIEQTTGEYESFRPWEVIADDEEEEIVLDRQIYLKDAIEKQADIEVGGFIEEPLEKVEFGRIAAQAASKLLCRKFVKPSVSAYRWNTSRALVK